MVKIVYDKESANCITHSGTMHADEVFATAFLDLFLGDVSVFRTSSIDLCEVDKNTLVYDIGRGEFDHHQNDKEVRENGIPYCALGLLWKKFGRSFLASVGYQDVDSMFNAIDKDLVEGIDADDNGFFPKIDAPYKVKTLPNIIKLFNPGFSSNQDESEQFLKAVSFAKMIWEEELIYINGKLEALKSLNNIFEKHDKNSKYLILDEYLPYEDFLLNNQDAENILFVAFPSNRGGYVVKTVPKSILDKTARCKFPKEWGGLEGKELENISGIKGLRFCHSERFIINCSSMETVYNVLDKLCQQDVNLIE